MVPYEVIWDCLDSLYVPKICFKIDSNFFICFLLLCSFKNNVNDKALFTASHQQNDCFISKSENDCFISKLLLHNLSKRFNY